MPPKKAAPAAAAPAAAKAKPKPKPEAKKKEKKEKEEPRPEDLIEKVPEPDKEAFDARLEKVQEGIQKLQDKQQSLNKRISERSGGKDEYTGRRSELRQEIDKWTSKMDQLKARKEEINKLMGNKKEEGLKAKDDLRKMEKSVGFNTEEEIDARIADIEFKMWTGSISLKEEKAFVKEIQDLKRNRPKVAKVNQLKSNIASDDKGKDLKEQLKDIGAQMGSVFAERQKLQEQLKELNEERNSKMGDLPTLISDREELSKQIQEKIKERNEIRAERKAAEDAHYQYLQKIRKVKQERSQQERIVRQKEYEERKKQREADKLDEQPYVQEIALVEQCVAFCKSLTQDKVKVEKEEKKEVTYELPKGAEMIVSKEDREEFYFEPTARGKKGKSKNKKEEGSSKAKPIKHNAVTYNLFDKLKLDAPLTTDDVPALLEKLEAKNAEFNAKVKEWELKREDLKKRILAGETLAEEEKEDEKEDEKEEEKEDEKEEEKEGEKEEEKEDEPES